MFDVSADNFAASIKIQGEDAQNHAVYAELKRVQQYFAKIKAAEEPEAKRTLTVNQEAAARILKADLVIFSVFSPQGGLFSD